MPQRKVVNLDPANTQQDSQNLLTARLECERRIETRATLLNKGKVKSRRVGDSLDVFGGVGLEGECC